MIGANTEKPSTIYRQNDRELNPIRTPKNNDPVLRSMHSSQSFLYRCYSSTRKNASQKEAKNITPPCINNWSTIDVVEIESWCL